MKNLKFKILAIIAGIFCVTGIAIAQSIVKDSAVTIPLKPDFSTPQNAVNSIMMYVGALATILTGYVPFIREWASTASGFKALKIGMAAIPVLVIIFIFGFRADVITIAWTTLQSIIMGLGAYALGVKPISVLLNPKKE